MSCSVQYRLNSTSQKALASIIRARALVGGGDSWRLATSDGCEYGLPPFTAQFV
jgi:hypothetical protein